MGFNLFASAPVQPETVAGILSQFTETVARLEAVVEHHNKQVQQEGQNILEAQARINESTAEISAAQAAAKNVRAIIGQ